MSTYTWFAGLLVCWFAGLPEILASKNKLTKQFQKQSALLISQRQPSVNSLNINRQK